MQVLQLRDQLRFDFETPDEVRLAGVAGLRPVHSTISPLAQALDQIIPSDRAAAEIIHLSLPMMGLMIRNSVF